MAIRVRSAVAAAALLLLLVAAPALAGTGHRGGRERTREKARVLGGEIAEENGPGLTRACVVCVRACVRCAGILIL